MKAKSLCFIIVLFTLFAIGCSDETAEYKSTTDVEAFIQSTDSLIYPITLGDEEGAYIFKQASNYKTSEIININDSWEIMYSYKPAPGFVGVDYVEIVKITGSDGASKPSRKETTKIKIYVEK